MSWTMRVAGPGDAEQVARVQAEGFDGYRSFAPREWQPPDPHAELERTRARLADRAVWCVLAEENGEPAGHAALMPASRHRVSSPDASLAHLWQLFVRPSWWGTGLASELHGRVLEEAGDRGFTTMRLFTPADQARARRFYEREGWTLAGEAPPSLEFGLPLVEYRIALRPAEPGARAQRRGL